MELAAFVKTPEAITAGKAIYDANCVACHSAKGEGLVGPNLTDNHWIHGGSLKDIRHVIVEGVIEKGMIPWKTSLTSEQIDQVVAFVWSIKGTNVPGKPAEGELVTE